MRIPALTIHQPYATFLARKDKRYETRDWGAPPKLVGSDFLIHASARKPTLGELGGILRSVPITSVQLPIVSYWQGVESEFPLGVGVCVARLAWTGAVVAF